MSAATNPDPPPRPSAAGFRLGRIVPLTIVVALSVTAFALVWYHEISLSLLIKNRAAVESVVAGHWIAALTAFVGIYFLVTALSVPGAAFVTIFGGLVFGTVAAGLATVIGATAGATVIFLIAKSALGDWLVRRAGRRVEKLAAGFCADAFNYLLFLRLVPLFPFWLVNLVPALCGVRLTTFVVATALGIIPGTFAFAFLGASLDSAIKAQDVTPLIVAALAALGVLTLVPMAVKRFKAARTPT
jgi:uncharacterized membrane protein YdjX (TVP38/TMEM64 family)